MELDDHLEAALDHTENETARYHIRAALQYAQSLEADPGASAAATGPNDTEENTAVDAEE